MFRKREPAGEGIIQFNTCNIEWFDFSFAFLFSVFRAQPCPLLCRVMQLIYDPILFMFQHVLQEIARSAYGQG